MGRSCKGMDGPELAVVDILGEAAGRGGKLEDRRVWMTTRKYDARYLNSVRREQLSSLIPYE